jgi:hypothetical protein
MISQPVSLSVRSAQTVSRPEPQFTVSVCPSFAWI